MAAHRNPDDPTSERGDQGTLVSVPRTPAAPAAAGTVVGLPRVPGAFAAPQFGAMAMPTPQPAPEAGATMIGIGRVPPPAPQSAPQAGATMIGIGRVPAAHPPTDAGATMIGIGRVSPANQAGFAAAPAAGGTMVGMAAVGSPGFGAFASSAPARPSGPPPAYEILGHLGGGELGEVFHARRRDSGTEVALRIVRPEIAAVPGAVDALRDVVSLAQAAVHTHLGKQLALDESASPTLVLEYVSGKQLAQLMRERGNAPAPAVIDLGLRLCSALAAAHAAGLAHGRVHAGNVVLEKTGRWVLLDLGHGYAVQGLEPAHDIYALGALLYELATGHSPFETESVADPRTYKPALPATLSALLLRTLAPDPALWFASAQELAQALVRAKTQP